ncbi:MAG: PIG-L deacetylase family protein [Candidatus Hodarchaeota archaeon]
MVIAPHQDDEVIGAGGKIIQTIKKGGRVFVVYVTNSVPKNHVKMMPLPQLGEFLVTLNRRIEAKIAMTLAGVPLKNLFFLDYNSRILEGYSNYPNSELTELVIELEGKIRNLIERLRPKEIYVSAYEGGHCDHDLINFIVSRIASELKLKRVYEMPYYPTNYPDYKKGLKYSIFQEFIPSNRDQLTSSYKIIQLELNKEEKGLKLKMLKVFRSQNPFIIRYMNKSDKFRLLPKYDYTKPPHEGELYRQGNLVCDITFEDFKNAVRWIV